MARQKEYDREKVLDAATHIFWEKGFKGTSVSDLVAATGLNKHSMYGEFGSKEGLFKECLDNFAVKVLKETNAILTRRPLGLANIEAFFLDRIQYSSSCTSAGCMLINTTVEKAHVDGGAFGQAQQYLEGLERNFLVNLEAAQQSGQIAGGRDLPVLAKYLLNATIGIMVMGKTNPPRESLEAVLHVTLSAIK